jgi:hypothetical protein
MGTALNTATQFYEGITCIGTRTVGLSRNLLRNGTIGHWLQDINVPGTLNAGLSFLTHDTTSAVHHALLTYGSPSSNVELYFDCNHFDHSTSHTWLNTGRFRAPGGVCYSQGNYFKNPNGSAANPDIQNDGPHAITYVRRATSANSLCSLGNLSPFMAGAAGVSQSQNNCQTCNGAGSGLCYTNSSCKTALDSAQAAKLVGLPTADAAALKNLWNRENRKLSSSELQSVLAHRNLTTEAERSDALARYRTWLLEEEPSGDEAAVFGWLESLAETDTFATWQLLPYYAGTHRLKDLNTALNRYAPRNPDEQAWHTFFSAQLSRLSDDRSYPQLTETEVKAFETVAQSCTQLAHSAANVLHVYDGREPYAVCPEAFKAEGFRPGRGTLPEWQAHATALAAYPNPNSGSFTLEIGVPEGVVAAEIRVTDPTGQVVHTQTVEVVEGKNRYELNLTHQPAGVYFIQTLGQSVKVVVVR